MDLCVILASIPAQPSFRGEAGGRGGCGSPGPRLTWSHHVGQGRRLNVHSALLVCMYIMTYPENPGEKFPSDTWLRALTDGLNQAVSWGEDGDVYYAYVDGGAARTGVQRLPCWLPPLPLLAQWPGDSSRCNDFLHESYAG